MTLNEYYVISNQMQLLERQIAEASPGARPGLYQAKAAFWPAYARLLGVPADE